MKSNYKRLGDYINPIKVKNVNLEATLLLGINIDKFFMPSVANVIGTDMTNYKIVKKNQFACNRMHVGRDYRIPIALSDKEEPFMVSPAYDVFEIIDTDVLLPEYLMMWFSRKEFDRNTWFYTDADVRGGLPMNAFLDLKLPIPSLEKQQEIVREYNIIQNRIALNNQLITKLEETAQAIYKHWFVDFEFPFVTSSGVEMPYKSNGGKMVWCEELEKEIPEGWEIGILGDYCTKITKGTTPKQMFTEKNDIAYVKYIKGESLKEMHLFDVDKISFIDFNTHKELNRSILEENDICYSIAGTLDKFAIVDKYILPANTNQAIAIIRVDEKKINRFYIFGLFLSNWQKEYYSFNIQQAVQANLSLETISSLPIIIPIKKVINDISMIVESIYTKKLNKDIENRKLVEIKDLLLSKLATIEK
ncbi:restriction endonuclease subunit S [Flavobacterium sp. N2270]|uniref:restriction endonuclease subunit S n=1 Tax=Flavobacterium sp. N2270 TaxID=2986831 RepID=UPI0022251EC7|nr:restriction endonuclease subunit S [Flavobacterium sp. N2270]